MHIHISTLQTNASNSITAWQERALEREEGTVTNDQAHILTAERLLTATFCTRGLIFDGMKHGTGKQFEEQSRYTKGIWKRSRLRREQRDCPTLNWRRISNNRCARYRKTQKSYRLTCRLESKWKLLSVKGNFDNDAYGKSSFFILMREIYKSQILWFQYSWL